ncbi:MAG: NUDIX domain-containing protein [Cyclobacteriaceae bacterium]
MPKLSAGLLMYRIVESALEVFLVHPGGPFFKNKDDGWWTIPKGLVEEGEDALMAACREFQEETGIVSHPPFMSLGSIKQKGGKQVQAWGFLGQWLESDGFISNTFEIEWPPRSGMKQSFPEINQARWFPEQEALIKINSAQAELIARLKEKIGTS